MPKCDSSRLAAYLRNCWRAEYFITGTLRKTNWQRSPRKSSFPNEGSDFRGEFGEEGKVVSDLRLVRCHS